MAYTTTCHAAFTSHLISLRSVNNEEEERQFSTINAISKATSNGHPEHTIPNCIILARAQQKSRCKKSSLLISCQRLESLPHIFLTSQVLSFLKSYLKIKCTRHTLSRLVSDFLLSGKGVWWHTDEEIEVVFHDSKGQPESRD